MRIYFASNRRYIEGAVPPFGNRYNLDGPAFYEVGYAELEPIPGAADADAAYRIASVEVEKGRPATPGRAGEDEFPASLAVFGDITREARESTRHVIAYLHGFNTSFDTCLHTAAQIHANWLPPKIGSIVFAFSWPADEGKGIGFGESGQSDVKWKYFSDRDDAEASGKAIARSLRRLADFLVALRRADREAGREPCPEQIHLVAHSMGNWALRHALLSLRSLYAGARLPKLFANVFLMAADEDADALEHPHKLGLLPQVADAVHVYHARRDLALIVSDTTKRNPDRLGAWGPRSFDTLDANIIGIDCNEVADTLPRHGRHHYFRLRPEVFADVRQVIAGRGPDQIRGRVAVRPGRQYRLKPASGKV
ncbi:alpha/beta hydrolase [Ancylobacter terrae]|uniref:alpha/beta hydrolase n=1 Tax=Ancylobacter sp. sgz301288 TaxID=3342077 RepID=UPI00385A1931